MGSGMDIAKNIGRRCYCASVSSMGRSWTPLKLGYDKRRKHYVQRRGYYAQRGFLGTSVARSPPRSHSKSLLFSLYQSKEDSLSMSGFS